MNFLLYLFCVTLWPTYQPKNISLDYIGIGDPVYYMPEATIYVHDNNFDRLLQPKEIMSKNWTLIVDTSLSFVFCNLEQHMDRAIERCPDCDLIWLSFDNSNAVLRNNHQNKTGYVDSYPMFTNRSIYSLSSHSK